MTTQKNHFVAKRIRQALTMISLNSALVSFLLLSLYASAEWETYIREDAKVQNTSLPNTLTKGPITMIRCPKSSCKFMRLKYYEPKSPLPSFFRSGGTNQLLVSYPKGKVGFKSAICPKNEIVASIECLGNCKKFRLRCKRVKNVYRVNDVIKNGPLISGSADATEPGQQHGRCNKGFYVKGINCFTNGLTDCDVVQPLCAKVEYQKSGGVINPPSPPKAPFKKKDCTDTQPSRSRDWTDRNGFTCEDYEEKKLCSSYGNQFADSLGRTANQSCCACGGGYDL